MARRLPIYFLIDVSESMVGEPIQQVEEGLATIMQTLKTDPYALETAYISIIVFAGQPKTLVPLQEIATFYPPRFPIGSGTSLSQGLGQLMFELRRNFVPTTYEQKGDWKPIVFLFTDGTPTDDTAAAITEWKQNWQKKVNMVAVSFGDESNTRVLSQLTDNVLMFNNSDSSAYKQFFKWVTDSIKTNSEKVEKGSTDFNLPGIDNDTITKIDIGQRNVNTLGTVDPNFVVLAGKCQNTKRPYLMKYRKTQTSSDIQGFNTLIYRLVGAFQVDNSYFDLASDQAPTQKVHTDELYGSPTCPCCGNQIGFAMCACGKIHCLGDEKFSTCPWCGNMGTYSVGEGGFDVNRTQG